jgi:hypothetical protein
MFCFQKSYDIKQMAGKGVNNPVQRLVSHISEHRGQERYVFEEQSNVFRPTPSDRLEQEFLTQASIDRTKQILPQIREFEDINLPARNINIPVNEWTQQYLNADLSSGNLNQSQSNRNRGGLIQPHFGEMEDIYRSVQNPNISEGEWTQQYLNAGLSSGTFNRIPTTYPELLEKRYMLKNYFLDELVSIATNLKLNPQGGRVELINRINSALDKYSNRPLPNTLQELANSKIQFSKYLTVSPLVFTSDEVMDMAKKFDIPIYERSVSDIIDNLVQDSGKVYKFPSTIAEYEAYGQSYSTLPRDVLNNIAIQLNIFYSGISDGVLVSKINRELQIIPRDLEELQDIGKEIENYSDELLEKMYKKFIEYYHTVSRYTRHDLLKSLKYIQIKSLDEISNINDVPPEVFTIICQRFRVPGQTVRHKINYIDTMRQLKKRHNKPSYQYITEPRVGTYENQLIEILKHVNITDYTSLTSVELREINNIIMNGNYEDLVGYKHVDWKNILTLMTLREVMYNDRVNYDISTLITRPVEMFVKLRSMIIDNSSRVKNVISYENGYDMVAKYAFNFRIPDPDIIELFNTLENMNEQEIQGEIWRVSTTPPLKQSELNRLMLTIAWAKYNSIKISHPNVSIIDKFYPMIREAILTDIEPRVVSTVTEEMLAKIGNGVNPVSTRQVIDYLEGRTDNVSVLNVGPVFYEQAFSQGLRLLPSIDDTPQSLRDRYRSLVTDDLLKRDLLPGIDQNQNVENWKLTHDQLKEKSHRQGLLRIGTKRQLIDRLEGNVKWEHDSQIDEYIQRGIELGYGSNEEELENFNEYIQGNITHFNINMVRFVTVRNLQYLGRSAEARRLLDLDDDNLFIYRLQELYHLAELFVYVDAYDNIDMAQPIALYRLHREGKVKNEHLNLLDTLSPQEVAQILTNNIKNFDILNWKELRNMYLTVTWLQDKGVGISIGINNLIEFNNNNLMKELKSYIDDYDIRDPNLNIEDSHTNVLNLLQTINSEGVSDQDYNNAVDFIQGRIHTPPANFNSSLAMMVREQLFDLDIINGYQEFERVLTSKNYFSLLDDMSKFGFNVNNIRKRLITSNVIVETITESQIRQFSMDFFNVGYKHMVKNPALIPEMISDLKRYPKLYVPNDFEVWELQYILNTYVKNKYLPTDASKRVAFKPLLEQLEKMQLVKANTSQSRL